MPILTKVTDSPLADVIPGRLRAVDSSSPIAFSKVRKWLRECDEKHSCAPQATKLPTRVLDLGEDINSQEAILVENHERLGRYIALSHCWGLSHRIKTLKSTIAAHKRGLAISALPRTFQDAIVASKKFGIRYLWIDTLCIIQDDAADWEHESSKMGDVYSNAYLTIAASSSTDDSSGLSPPRTIMMDKISYASSDLLSHGRPGRFDAIPDGYIEDGSDQPAFAFTKRTASFTIETKDGPAKTFLTPEWMPSSRKEEPLTYQIGSFGRSFDPLLGEPLSTRGWTVQERLLSPRTIHYGTAQMFWECQECILAEDGAYFEPSCRSLPTLKDLPFGFVLPEDSNMGVSKTSYSSDSEGSRQTLSQFDSWNRAWVRLVEEYTSRKLTNDSDKLPALAGLARKLSAHSGETYLAGLWRGSVLDTLNWRVVVQEPDHMCDDPEHDAQLPPPRKADVKSLTCYGAPSWSWASINAQIEYPYGVLHSKAKLVDYHLVPVDSDPFGRLQSGWIKIWVRLSYLTH
jgi:hypothetical protein